MKILLALILATLIAGPLGALAVLVVWSLWWLVALILVG